MRAQRRRDTRRRSVVGGHLTRARRQRANAEKITNEKRLAHIGIPQIAYGVCTIPKRKRAAPKNPTTALHRTVRLHIICTVIFLLREKKILPPRSTVQYLHIICTVIFLRYVTIGYQSESQDRNPEPNCVTRLSRSHGTARAGTLREFLTVGSLRPACQFLRSAFRNSSKIQG